MEENAKAGGSLRVAVGGNKASFRVALATWIDEVAGRERHTARALPDAGAAADALRAKVLPFVIHHGAGYESACRVD